MTSPLLRVLSAACGLLAALALFTIMGLTLVDVGGRKLLDHSLPGSLELTEVLMVAVIFAGLPLTSLRGEHVLFDSLDSRIPPALHRAQRGLMNFLSGVMLLGLAWLMAVKAAQIAGYGDTTAQLKIPVSPMVWLMSVLLAVAGALHLWLVVRPDAGNGAGHAPEIAQ